MERESAPDAEDRGEDVCPDCGYHPQKRDRSYIEDYDVWHVVCYNCGKEWVE